MHPVPGTRIGAGVDGDLGAGAFDKMLPYSSAHLTKIHNSAGLAAASPGSAAPATCRIGTV